MFTHTHTHTHVQFSLGIPGTCIVVMVVVVIRVVVVSSSMDSGDRGFLVPVWLAAEELKAVVSSPGEMTVAVDSAWPSPGTACVGLVVVPAGEGGWLFSNERSPSLDCHLATENCSCMCKCTCR